MRLAGFVTIILLSVFATAQTYALTIVTHFWSGPCPDGVAVIPNGCRDGATTALPGPIDLSDGVNTLREGFLMAAQNWEAVIEDKITIELAPYQYTQDPALPPLPAIAFANQLIVEVEKSRKKHRQFHDNPIISLLKKKSIGDIWTDLKHHRDIRDAIMNADITLSLPRPGQLNALVDPANFLPLTDNPTILITLSQLRALGVRANIDAIIEPRFAGDVPLPQISDPESGELRFIDALLGFNAEQVFDPEPRDGIGGLQLQPEDFQQAVLDYIAGITDQPHPDGARSVPLVYDFVGAAAHEIGHVLGAVLNTRQEDPAVVGDATDTADLFRFHESTARDIDSHRDFRKAERYWILNPFGTPFETIDENGNVLHQFESFGDCFNDPANGFFADSAAIGCKERENNVHVYGLKHRKALSEGVYNGEFGGAIHLKDDQPLVFDGDFSPASPDQRCFFGDSGCRFVAGVKQRRSLMAVFGTPFLADKIEDPDLNVLNNLGWNIRRSRLDQQNQTPSLEKLVYFEDDEAGTDPGIETPFDITLEQLMKQEDGNAKATSRMTLEFRPE